ncbi:MAG: Asp-tRNA(Asn)/Glu-tRNA(Gln) amidotransferase subunit GatB [Myxococcales bacterium]|nr:MAG: Asp-tRNA(Asn)/Glu-tRNA(Gln) amidotransferase subunit GatB [Myxococcales bacterium]
MSTALKEHNASSKSAFEPVIGLEVHAQLLSHSKLFSTASAAFGAAPNTQIAPVCLGLPGALPVLNAKAVEMAVQAALALGCSVRPWSRFDRKHYFYPDLPKGYQISQFDRPYAEEGKVEIQIDNKPRTLRIQRIHMEEDAAKNIHGAGGGSDTLVDFNRSGVPLIEIVSHPDMRSAAEAEAYLRQLREVLLFVGVNDGNLEEGSFRCDANVSIRPVGQEKFGTRVELKNINSFRFVRKAIEYEIIRQEALISGGGTVVQETRTWSDGQGKTLAMRGKEEAHDYRYFPDPDLPPLVLRESFIAEQKEKLPELAEAKRERWQSELGLTEKDAEVLSGHPAVAGFFEQSVQLCKKQWPSKKTDAIGKRVANFVQGEVLRHTQTTGLEANIPVTAQDLAELLILVEDNVISGKMAKDVFSAMISTGHTPKQIVDEQGLAQVTDVGAIDAEVQKVLDANPDKVAQYKDGKQSLIGFFVGQVMRATGGAANPKLVNESLRRLLGS